MVKEREDIHPIFTKDSPEQSLQETPKSIAQILGERAFQMEVRQLSGAITSPKDLSHQQVNGEGHLADTLNCGSTAAGSDELNCAIGKGLWKRGCSPLGS